MTSLRLYEHLSYLNGGTVLCSSIDNPREGFFSTHETERRLHPSLLPPPLLLLVFTFNQSDMRLMLAACFDATSTTGMLLTQSRAIVEHIARTCNLYGADDYEAAKCDMVVHAVCDFEVGTMGYPFAEDKKVKLKECKIAPCIYRHTGIHRDTETQKYSRVCFVCYLKEAKDFPAPFPSCHPRWLYFLVHVMTCLCMTHCVVHDARTYAHARPFNGASQRPSSHFKVVPSLHKACNGEWTATIHCWWGVERGRCSTS